MNDDCPESGDDILELKQSEREALLAEYQEVREELRENATLLHSRVSRGIAAIGAVIGYALLAEGGRPFISIVPLIIAFIYLLTLNSIQNMLILSRRSYDIEEKIMPEGQGWEHQYGGLLPHSERKTSYDKFPQIDLSDIASATLVVLSALIYVVFIFISWRTVNELEITIAGVDSGIIIILSYAILTVFLIPATKAYSLVFQKIKPESS